MKLLVSVLSLDLGKEVIGDVQDFAGPPEQEQQRRRASSYDGEPGQGSLVSGLTRGLGIVGNGGRTRSRSSGGKRRRRKNSSVERGRRWTVDSTGAVTSEHTLTKEELQRMQVPSSPLPPSPSAKLGALERLTKFIDTSSTSVNDANQPVRGNPYIWLKLKEQETQTSVAGERCSWLYNEDFEFEVEWLIDQGRLVDDDLCLEIECRDSLDDSRLGSIRIPLIRLSSGGVTTKQWYELLEQSERTCGVLQLGLTFEAEEESNNDDESLATEDAKMRKKQNEKNMESVRVNPMEHAKLEKRLAEYVVLCSPEAILVRYPANDHADLALPVKIEWFCFAPLKLQKDSCEFYTFVHAPRGLRLYGFCLAYLNAKARERRCMCIVSRLGFPETFEGCLREMHEKLDQGLDETTILNRAGKILVEHVPMPLPGCVQIKFDLGLDTSGRMFECDLGSYGGLPSMTFSRAFDMILDRFDVGRLVEIWVAVLLEYKVLMHSSEPQMLSVLGETLLSILYPFRWHHTYIPMLPKQLLEFVQAPLPFILGLDSGLLPLLAREDLCDAVVVDIDRGELFKGATLKIPMMPATEHRRLFRMIRHIHGIKCKIDSPLVEDWWHVSDNRKDCKKTQQAFVECVSSMLQGYRECLFFLNQSMPVFNQPQFLEQRGQDAIFFTRLLETQCFEHFKETQQSRWLRFFHACYFQQRIRQRDREQYIALESQRNKARRQLRGSRRTSVEELQFARAQYQRSILFTMEQNPMIWEARERRLLYYREGVDESQTQIVQKRIDFNNMETENDADVEETTTTSANEEEAAASNPASYDTKPVDPWFQGFAHGLDPMVIPIDEDDDDENENEQGRKKKRIKDSNFLCVLIVNATSDGTVLTTEYVSKLHDIQESKLVAALHDLKCMVGIHKYSMDGTSEGACEASKESRDNLYDDKNDDDKGEQRIRRSQDEDMKDIAILAKSVEDRKVEKTLQESVTRIFLNQSVSKDQLKNCGKCFNQSKHARDLFVLILFQPHHRLSFGQTGRGLKPNAFESLVVLSTSLIEACALREDYSNGRQMLELSRSYYKEEAAAITSDDDSSNATDDHVEQIMGPSSRVRTPTVVGEYLESRLHGLALWNNILFWEHAFGETLAMEMRKRVRSLSTSVQEPPNLTDASGDMNINDIGHTDDPETRQETLFELVTNLVYTMIRLGVSQNKAKALVNRVVTEHGLSETNEETLYTLINNISRALHES